MARLKRVTSKLFAENATATNIGQFGSLNAGTKVETNDIDTIQALPAWGDGWEAAGLGQNCYPTLQERNGLDYVQSYFLNYLLQEGIAEWDANTTYYTGSIVKLINGTNVQLYQSLKDNNTAVLSDTNSWKEWNYANVDLANITNQAKILMSSMGMPSDKYIGLTLGASGATYTAPANGWMYLVANLGTDIQMYSLSGLGLSSAIHGNNNNIATYLPCKKGDIVQIVYQISNLNRFEFVYAEGSK